MLCRATFTGATLLQEVCSYLEQHSPDGIAPGYKLVSHHLRREFGQGDMAKSLHELGVASMTSLRLHDVQATTGKHAAELIVLLLHCYKRSFV